MAAKEEEVAEAPIDEDDATFLNDTRVEAEKGSVDHQLFLGRYYIKHAQSNTDLQDYATNAVHWLIKASNNASKEATVLLRECLDEKIGVNEDNVDDIRACLRMSDLQKSIRLAARKLYKELSPAGDNSPYGKDIYIRRVKEFTSEKKEKKFLISTANKLSGTDVVEEDAFVDTVARRMQSGQIDPSQDEIEMAVFSEASFTRKITKYPGATLTMGTDMIVEFITTDLVNLLMYLLPIDQINVLIAFFLLSLLTFSWLFTVAALTTFYLTLIVLIVSTLQMFKNKRKQTEVKSMAKMLRKYCDGVDAKAAESAFIQNSTKPYITFLATLLVFVPSFFLANKSWIPCSELALVATLAALGCIIYLSVHDDPVVMVSYGFDLLSCMPHILAGFPEVPIISHVVNFLTVPFYSLQITPGFYLNLSFPSLEYAIVPLLFARMAYKDSWQGLYRVLFPHLVGFFWLQVAVAFFDHSTWLGLARGSMGWVAFIILFPFVTFAGTIYGIYYIIISFNLLTLFKILVTLTLLLTPVLLSIWQGYGFALGPLSLRGKSLKIKLMVVLIPVLLLLPVLFLMSGADGEDSEDMPFMPWELYRERCGQPAWERTNMADAQRACEHFRFMQVNWTATFEGVNITDIENPADSFLENFPEGVAEWLKCLYGKRYEECDNELMSNVDYELCELRLKYGRTCHMKDKRSYTFMLTVLMPLGNDEYQRIPMIADNEFKDILFELKKGDIVEVRAVLQKRLGSSSPVIKLENIKCTTCMMLLKEAHSISVDPLKQSRRALFETISFFTSPVLEYHRPKTRQEKREEQEKMQIQPHAPSDEL